MSTLINTIHNPQHPPGQAEILSTQDCLSPTKVPQQRASGALMRFFDFSSSVLPPRLKAPALYLTKFCCCDKLK